MLTNYYNNTPQLSTGSCWQLWANDSIPFSCQNHNQNQISFPLRTFVLCLQNVRVNKTVYSILLPLPSMWKSWTALADAAQELKSEHSAVTVWWMKMYVYRSWHECLTIGRPGAPFFPAVNWYAITKGLSCKKKKKYYRCK